MFCKANPNFLPGSSLVFSMYIEMNNKIKFQPTFNEMTLFLVTMSDISNVFTGTPNFFGLL